VTILIDYVKVGRTGIIKYFSVTVWLFNTLAAVKENTYLQDHTIVNTNTCTTSTSQVKIY